jgi:hypothetical protein
LCQIAALLLLVAKKVSKKRPSIDRRISSCRFVVNAQVAQSARYFLSGNHGNAHGHAAVDGAETILNKKTGTQRVGARL